MCGRALAGRVPDLRIGGVPLLAAWTAVIRCNSTYAPKDRGGKENPTPGPALPPLRIEEMRQ